MYEDQTLESLAKQISENVKKADDHSNQADEHINQADQLVIEAAKMVVAAKKRVIQGEFSDTGWYGWADEHIGLKPTRLDELLSIGNAKDPLGRAREIRELAKARARRHRDKNKVSPSRNGKKSKTEGSAVPAAEAASGDSATDPEPKPQPEGDSTPAPEMASDKPGQDQRPGPEKPLSEQLLSEEDREQRELIAKFTEWALTASISDLRHEVLRIIDPMRIPANMDRRPNRDAA